MANMLESPLAMSLERGKVPYVAFDMHPARLKPAREAGFNVLYGDASRPSVSPPWVFSDCQLCGQATQLCMAELPCMPWDHAHCPASTAEGIVCLGSRGLQVCWQVLALHICSAGMLRHWEKDRLVVYF